MVCMSGRKKVKTSIKIDPDLWKEVKIQAIRQDLTVSAAVQEALEQWIDKRAKKEGEKVK